jgi:cobalt/nickel transport system permease protein
VMRIKMYMQITSFLLVMQPIHLAIGLVEGIATAGVVSFIWKARPEILDRTMHDQPFSQVPVRNIIAGLLAASVLIGGVLSWYSSEHPDGLEWSIRKVTGNTEIVSPSEGVHDKLARIQQKTSYLPDYTFKENDAEVPSNQETFGTYTGTTLSGLIGGLLVLACGVLIGLVLKKRNQPVCYRQN